MTYMALELDPARPLAAGTTGWRFAIDVVATGETVPEATLECVGRAGTITQDHAWGCAVAYYNELGHQIVEIVEGTVTA